MMNIKINYELLLVIQLLITFVSIIFFYELQLQRYIKRIIGTPAHKIHRLLDCFKCVHYTLIGFPVSMVSMYFIGYQTGLLLLILNYTLSFSLDRVFNK